MYWNDKIKPLNNIGLCWDIHQVESNGGRGKRCALKVEKQNGFRMNIKKGTCIEMIK